MRTCRAVVRGVIFLAALGVLTAGCAGAGYPAGARSSLSDLAVLKDYESRRVTSEDRAGNADMRSLPPGATLVIADLDGPGEVTHIWMTISSPDPEHFTNLVLRVFYDGLGYPSVEAPLGDFFGLGMNQEYYFSTPVLATGTIRGLNSFWPMPFRKGARLELTNEGALPAKAVYFYVDWRRFKRAPKNAGYFHAQYRQAFPAATGENYTILETAGGRGHFAGAHMSVLTQVPGWWGEGDDIFTIDGEARPSMWGTGSEDYFCGAWCYGDTFHADYFGMPLRSKPGQRAGAYWNVYRYHLESPVAFRESLTLEIEHGDAGFNNTRRGGNNNNYSSVAYWYMEKPARLIGGLPPAAARRSVFDPPPAPEGVIEAQLMEWTVSPGMGAEIQGLGEFTRDGRKWLLDDHLWGNRAVTSGTVELTFEVEDAASGEGIALMTAAPDYGIVRLALDGETLAGAVNLFARRVEPVVVKLGDIDLAPGRHTLTITMLGRDSRSLNNMWGLDYLRVGGEPREEEKAARVYE